MPDWKEALDWSRSALVVVDMQNDFSGLPGGHEVVPNLQRVIDAAHAAGRPVVFLKTIHDEASDTPVWRSRRRGKPEICLPGTWGVEYFGVAPTEGDLEVIKHRYSGFFRTDLEERLRALGVEVLICGGIATDVCVHATIRDGFMSDFYTVLLEDCAAGTSEEAHENAVKSLGRNVCWVSDSHEVSALLAALRPEAHLVN